MGKGGRGRGGGGGGDKIGAYFQAIETQKVLVSASFLLQSGQFVWPRWKTVLGGVPVFAFGADIIGTE